MRCVICDSTEVFLLEERVECKVRIPIDVHICPSCGVITTPPFIGNDEVALNSQNYYQGILKNCVESTINGLLAPYRDIMNLVRQLTFFGGGKVCLDFGCGMGLLSIAAAESGFSQVYGIDLSLDASKSLEKYYPIPPNVMFCDNIKKVKCKVDMVILWHVLEQVPDPVDVLRKILAICHSDAVLIMRFPLYDGKLLEGFQNFFFGHTSIRRLLEKVDCGVISQIYDDSHSVMTILARRM